ncbi:hypothetical protein HMPREF9946_03110 [Acetobacteraceae bacterium AT-5844]|nr:hypothetical protein HMPREF9946_03110 [Acetobacteraceae bacterium AT-5844]
MQRVMRELAEAEKASTSQRTIERLARLIGFTYRRAYGFFYGTARTVTAEEWIAAQNAVMASRRARAARLRAELAALETITDNSNAENMDAWSSRPGMDGGSLLGRCGVVQDARRCP